MWLQILFVVSLLYEADISNFFKPRTQMHDPQLCNMNQTRRYGVLPKSRRTFCLRVNAELHHFYSFDLHKHLKLCGELLRGSRAQNNPKAIICKFVRRMAKEKVMSARNEVKKIQPSQLGLQTELISRLGLYDHLSPRLQTLFYEAKKYKIANEYKFCWTKNGAVFLRESDTSHIKRLNKLQDLITLQE